jgi:hypothetical protein
MDKKDTINENTIIDGSLKDIKIDMKKYMKDTNEMKDTKIYKMTKNTTGPGDPGEPEEPSKSNINMMSDGLIVPNRGFRYEDPAFKYNINMMSDDDGHFPMMSDDDGHFPGEQVDWGRRGYEYSGKGYKKAMGNITDLPIGPQNNHEIWHKPHGSLALQGDLGRSLEGKVNKLSKNITDMKYILNGQSPETPPENLSGEETGGGKGSGGGTGGGKRRKRSKKNKISKKRSKKNKRRRKKSKTRRR